MKYFLTFAGTKNEAPTNKKSIINAVFIRHCSESGYIPYTNLPSQTLIKTQQAPLPLQSSFVSPKKLASKKNQFNNGGINLIKAKSIKSVRIALKLFELKFVLILSNNLLPLN